MTDIAKPAEALWTRARAMFSRAVAAIGDAATIARIATLTPQLRRRIIAWLCPLENIVRKLLLAEAAQLHRTMHTAGPRLIRIPLRGLARAPGVGPWAPDRAPRVRDDGEIAKAPQARTAGLQARNATIGQKCALESARSNFAPSQDRSAGLQARNATIEQKCALESARSNLEAARSCALTLDNARFSFSLPRDPHAVPEARAPRLRSLWGACTPPPTPTATPRTYDESKSPLRLARRFAALRRVLDDPRPHAERLARLLARAVRRFPEIVRRYLFAPARTNDYDPDDPRLAIEAISQAFAAPAAFTDSS